MARPVGIPSEKKGKTFEEMYSPEKAEYMRQAAIRGRLGRASEKKGKTWAELYGPERAAEITEKNRQAQLNRSLEINAQISFTLTGRKNPEHSKKMKELWQTDDFRNKLIPHLRDISGITNKPTNLEQILFVHLNKIYLGEEIVRYHSIEGCRYRVDCAIPKLKLAFEADGEYWHTKPGIPEHDAKRDEIIRSCGWEVIRYSEAQLISIGAVSFNQDIPEGAHA